jgi:hypothetical protein
LLLTDEFERGGGDARDPVGLKVIEIRQKGTGRDFDGSSLPLYL